MNVLVGGRYRLLERIGSGGMGVVWLARDEVLRRRVAVKELHHGWGSSDRTVAEGRERSLREARAAAALHHPNIVAVYDTVEHDGRPWIVMELVAGRSLKEIVVEDGPLPVERTVGIGLQLLSALQAAHAAGITHRDVKPANVLICDGDVVRLTDFGLATMPDAETLTETGVVLGTPGYLAPEQANGQTPGPPADVFGLGATLYYAVEGVGPFHRDGYLPMLAAYARHDLRPPQHAGALGPAILRLLAVDPAKRPSAEQARDMLQGGAVRRPGVSRRLILTGGAVSTVAAVGVGLWLRLRGASAGGRAATAAPSRSQSRPSVGLGSPVWHRDDLAGPVLVGSVLVGVDRDGVAQAVDLETGRQRWRRGPSHETFQAVAVGAERVLVNDEADRVGEVLDVATGAVRSRYKGRTSAVEGLILARDTSSTVIGYDAVTGRQLWRVRSDHGGFDNGYFSSPSGLLYAWVRRDDGDLPPWLYGINQKTGAVVWKTQMTSESYVIGPWGDGDFAYAAVVERENWTLVAVDARTGTRRWSAPVGKFDSKQPDRAAQVTSVASVGGLVVAAVQDPLLTLEQSGLIAVDAGVVRWRRPLLNPVNTVSPDGRLFAASFDSRLDELDPTTGKSLWSIVTPGPVDRITVTSTMLFATIQHSTTGYRLPVR